MTHSDTNVIADARVETTTIAGLELHHTKVVGDSRGMLAELIRNGSANPILGAGLGNLYVSIAMGKHIARAGHHHTNNLERFFTLSGCALWYFSDLREDSPTRGHQYACVLGADRPRDAVPDPVYVLADIDMVRAIVPTGVYHVFWPLTEAPVSVLAAASVSHELEDVVRTPWQTVHGCAERVAQYGIHA
ncbi:MAG: hypothetical protein Q7T01_01525 [bacterium]|nr:hypothetical protein [bacterium]